MTQLADYLEATGEKQRDFAVRCETTPATISRICSGTLKPALDLAHRIERETNGAVPTETWLKDAEIIGVDGGSQEGELAIARLPSATEQAA